jgi:predicted PhzF superfamily epimerase YddE/YHI9
MQAIAAWLNLSETTFVLPPTQAGADHRLRIFTPRQELPFAGHPSVGTAHAMLERRLVQPREGRWVQECAAALLPVKVEGEGAERRMHVRARWGVEREGDPADGIPEDPVTGSANAGITARMHANGVLPAPRFLSSQGREVGRDGIVEITIDDDGEVWIGGQTQTVIEGALQW